MAKIRGIKPEIWTDEKFVELTPYARLLFIGLWNYMCDNGHIEDKSKQIKLRILPADDCNVAELIRELEKEGLITRSGGWITIDTFEFHQRVDPRWFLTCDKPECTKPDTKTANPKRKTRSGHAVGTAEPRSASPWPHDDVDGDVDGDGELMVINPSPANAVEETNPFDEFWDTYDKKEGKKKAHNKWNLALKKKGVTAKLLIDAAAEYIAWKKSEGKHPEFTKDPATWLNGEHWNDERTAHSAPQNKTDQRMQSNVSVIEQLQQRENVTQLRQIGQQP